MNHSSYPAWSILSGGVCLTWGVILSPFAAEVACPFKHDQWETLPHLTDEFDGNRLDESKWFPNNPDWLGRQPDGSALQTRERAVGCPGSGSPSTQAAIARLMPWWFRNSTRATPAGTSSCKNHLDRSEFSR